MSYLWGFEESSLTEKGVQGAVTNVGRGAEEIFSRVFGCVSKIHKKEKKIKIFSKTKNNFRSCTQWLHLFILTNDGII